MDISALIEIFEDSKNKNIDIWCDGKLAIQFKKCATKVTNEGNGTISVKETCAGFVHYIDSSHVSHVLVNTFGCQNINTKAGSPFLSKI